MAVHLLKESIFWAAEKGFRESEVSSDWINFGVAFGFCLSPRHRPLVIWMPTLPLPVPTTEAANAELRSQVSNKTTRLDDLGSGFTTALGLFSCTQDAVIAFAAQ
jgi:hypothetical protein